MYGFGKIQELGEETDDNGDPYTARVVPENSDGVVTLPLYIPLHLRGIMQNAKVDETVFFAENGESGGVILALIPPYVDGTYQDWDMILRNTLPIQVNGDLHVMGNVTVDGDTMTAGNSLVEGNADIIGDLAVDGKADIGTAIQVTSSGVTLGGTVKIGGVTATGAKAFNGFPAGSDTFTGAPVSQDTVNAPPLAGGVANGNKGNYTPAEENEEREAE